MAEQSSKQDEESKATISVLEYELDILKQENMLLKKHLYARTLLDQGARIGQWILDKGTISYTSKWKSYSNSYIETDTEHISIQFDIPPFFHPNNDERTQILSKARDMSDENWIIKWERPKSTTGAIYTFKINKELWNIIRLIQPSVWSQCFSNEVYNPDKNEYDLTLPARMQSTHKALSQQQIIEMMLGKGGQKELRKPQKPIDYSDILGILKHLNVDIIKGLPRHCRARDLEDFWKNIIYAKRSEKLTQKQMLEHCKNQGHPLNNLTYVNEVVKFLRDLEILNKDGQAYIINMNLLDSFCKYL